MIINWMKKLNKYLKLLKISGFWLKKKSPKHLIVSAVIAHLIFVECYMIFGIIYVVNVESIEKFSEAVGVIPISAFLV